MTTDHDTANAAQAALLARHLLGDIRARVEAYDEADRAYREACKSDNNMRLEWDTLCKLDDAAEKLLDHAPTDIRALLALVDQQQRDLDTARRQREIMQTIITRQEDEIHRLNHEIGNARQALLLAVDINRKAGEGE